MNENRSTKANSTTRDTKNRFGFWFVSINLSSFRLLYFPRQNVHNRISLSLLDLVVSLLLFHYFSLVIHFNRCLFVSIVPTVHVLKMYHHMHHIRRQIIPIFVSIFDLCEFFFSSRNEISRIEKLPFSVNFYCWHTNRMMNRRRKRQNDVQSEVKNDFNDTIRWRQWSRKKKIKNVDCDAFQRME